MAGALGLALAGPRTYDGVAVDDAVMGFGRRDANAGDIRQALSLFRRADAALILLLGAADGLVHRASLSRRSISRCALRCAASASSVASTSVS